MNEDREIHLDTANLLNDACELKLLNEADLTFLIVKMDNFKPSENCVKTVTSNLRLDYAKIILEYIDNMEKLSEKYSGYIERVESIDRTARIKVVKDRMNCSNIKIIK